MQALTFDFHNTIANSDPWFELEVRGLPWAVAEALAGAHDAHRPAIDDAYRQLRREVIATGREIDAYAGTERILANAGLCLDARQIAETVDALMRDCLEATEVVPGAVETIRRLHDRGIRLGIVSSAVHHQTLEWTLERLGIRACFAAIVTSASSGYYKSSRRIYDYALGALGATATCSMHIGDSLRWDVETSQAAGMQAAWLQTGRPETYAPLSGEHLRPNLVLNSLVDADEPILAHLNAIRTPASD